MTSTEFTVGLDGSRVSSKVLKPPGGGSSDIFGSSASQLNEQCKAQDNSSTKNRLFGSAPINTNIATPQRNQSKIFLNDNQASLSKKQVRRNPITGEGIEYTDNEKTENSEKENEDNIQDCDSVEKNVEVATKPETPKVIQTSIRVRNPPGGKSSGIF